MKKRFETPARQMANLIVKMENFNYGGSHKSRAARFIIEDAIRNGFLHPQGKIRILEKTGGNLGVGLAFEASKFGIGVDLVVGLSFSSIKKKLCEQFGARLIGHDLLLAGMTPKEVIDHFLLASPEGYHYTNQFGNEANLDAHVNETGPEFARQIAECRSNRRQKIILVAGAGTGASFQGIATALLGHFDNVDCHLVMPENCDLATNTFCDHKLEGFAVGVVPPFLELGLVNYYHALTYEDARHGQRKMASELGFFPGVSSGANYTIARRLATENPSCLVVTICYDSGEAYLLTKAIHKSTEAMNVAVN